MYRELINYATETYPFLIEHTDVRYIPHFHEETELVYVTDGKLDFTLGTKSYLIKKGDICVIPSGMIHNLYTKSHSKTFVMKLFPIVNLSGVVLKNYIITKDTPEYISLKQCICHIMQENNEKSVAYELAVNVNAEKIFLIILREMEHYEADAKIKTRRNNEKNFFRTVNSFLESHYQENFSLGDIAEFFGYTGSYFCRYFRKIAGNSFWEYYTMFRLEKAVQIIKESPKENFTTVSNMSGFKNVRSFNQSFKTYYRCTPGEYRKMLTKYPQGVYNM